MECLNEACRDNRNHRCYNLLDTISGCNNAIQPTHTPTYAEEQLQHAIEKEKKGSSNMDKDYKSLWEDSVKENKALEEENTHLTNEKDDLEIENRKLTNEIKELKGKLEFERNMYANSKDKCKSLEVELKEEILKSRKIIKN